MPGGSERGDGGSTRFTPTITDEAILERFEEGRPFHTANEVAEWFDVDRSTAYRHLSDLADEGSLEKVKVGSRTVVWWLPAADEEETTAPAAPLRNIVGVLDEDEADRARDRSREWREQFDSELEASEP